MRLRSPLLILVLSCCLSVSNTNRVYVHPFSLFATSNVSCESLQTQSVKTVEMHSVAPLDNEVLTPDNRDPTKLDVQRQNITKRTAVLAELLNALGLRMYQEFSRKHNTNTLLSPVNTFGSLVTFFLGASKKTARQYQRLLGLSSDTDREDCVSLIDGHKVLQTLQGINSLVDDGPKDEITTQVWAFTHQSSELSEDFIQGMKDFSDASFVRGVDFSKPQEAEQLMNSFVEKTSQGKVKDIFKELNSSSDLLFITSFNFQGNWRTAFHAQKTALHEFYVDNTTSVKAPMMTHTGQFLYLKDKLRQCTVVKLPLSKQSHMLLVLPNEGVKLDSIESRLRTDVMADWHQELQEGLLELSFPKFSMSSDISLHDLLSYMAPEVEAELLGSQADFSPLSSTKDFTIHKAINKVIFEMSDEGAESDKRHEEGVPVKLSINRPFFFSVIEGKYNSILMLGKITNPTL
ncbi:angiotensinogen [Pholidichthys leucotaenia]